MKINEAVTNALHGLGRCSTRNWDAHYPAAVLAGIHFCENNDLPEATVTGVLRQVALIQEHYPEIFNRYPSWDEEGGDASGSDLEPNVEEKLLEAISTSIDTFSELGHNTIFLYYALLAIRRGGAGCSKALAADLAHLIRKFKYGPAMFWIKLAKGRSPKTFRISKRSLLLDEMSGGELATAVLSEFVQFDHIYTQMGSKSHIGHLLTQVHSLIGLKQMGYGELANRGLNSLETRLVLLRDFRGYKAPENSFYVPASRSPWLPTDAEYWAQDFACSEWDEGHCLKYTFSFYELLRLAGDPKLQTTAEEKLRYLIVPSERSHPR